MKSTWSEFRWQSSRGWRRRRIRNLRLWKLLVAGTTRTELVSRLGKEQAIAPERAEADVDAFLEVLDREGLLRRG